MAEKIALEIDIDAKGSVQSLGQLEKEAERLNEELRKVPLGSQAFKDLQKELIGVNKEIKNTELAMESLDNEQVASELGSVAGAVGDVSAAFVLLGGGNGAIEQTVQKIEKAIGISMAFKGTIEGTQSALKLFNNLVKTGTIFQKANNIVTKAATVVMGLFSKSVNVTSTSFRVLKGAIAATGIGLLVVAVGELVSLFMSMGDETTDLEGQFTKMTERIKVYNDNVRDTLQIHQDINKELKRQFALEKIQHQKRIVDLKEQGASAADIHQEEIDFRSEEIKLIDNQISLSKTGLKTMEQAYKDIRKETQQFERDNRMNIDHLGSLHLMEEGAAKQRIQATTDQYNSMLEATELAYLDLQAQQEITADLENQKQILLIQHQIDEANYRLKLKQEKTQKKTNNLKKDSVKITQEELDLQERMAKIAYGFEILAKIEEYYSETAAMRRDSFDQELLDEQNKFEELMMNAQNFNAMLTDEEQNKRINTEQLEEEHQERMAKIRLRQKDAEIDASNTIKQALIDDYNARFQAEKELMTAKIGLARSGLQVLGAIAGEESKLQNALFVLDKALAIGEIIVNTQREIAGIAASYATIPGGQLVAAPLIAAAKIRSATGIATVVATSLAKFKGGGAGGATSALGGGAATASPGQAPPLQPANTSLLVPQQQNQVYVTETDITNVQNQVAVIQGMGGFN
jgi:hypothetical protein